MNVLYNQTSKGCVQDELAFYQTEIVVGVISAEIPCDLCPMSESMQEIFYPYEKRPDLILADEQGKNQMTFEMLNKNMKAEETEMAADALREYISQMYSRSELSPVYLYRTGNIRVGWFAMTLEMEEGEVYCHRKAVLSVHNQMFLVTASYPQADRLKWDVIFKHTFDTWKEMEGKPNDSNYGRRYR